MSAFTLPETHINVLINAGLDLRHGATVRWRGPDGQIVELTRENADRVGNMLLLTNYQSVNYRYQEDAVEPVYNYRRTPRRVQALAAIKAANCYAYQSCEHHGWEDSEAERFITALILALVCDVEGYDDLPWAIGSLKDVRFL